MNILDAKIKALHNYLQQLFEWSNSLSPSEKTRIRQLFADLWLLDIELMQFLNGNSLPEWTN